ncbi:MAG: hypothetical protein AB1324_03200, partial [Candidatus Micrarchaeota archaeon]
MSAGRISIAPSAGTRHGGGQSPVGRYRPILEHIILGKPLEGMDGRREQEMGRLLARFGELAESKGAGGEGRAIVRDLATRIKTPIIKLTLERLITLAENVPERDLRAMLADARTLMNEDHERADTIPRIMENAYFMTGGRYLGLQTTRKVAMAGFSKSSTNCGDEVSKNIRIAFESGSLDGIEIIAEVRARMALEALQITEGANAAPAAQTVPNAAPPEARGHTAGAERAAEAVMLQAMPESADRKGGTGIAPQLVFPDPSQYAQLSGISRLKAAKEEAAAVPGTSADVPLRVADYFRTRRNAETTRKLAKAAADVKRPGTMRTAKEPEIRPPAPAAAPRIRDTSRKEVQVLDPSRTGRTAEKKGIAQAGGRESKTSPPRRLKAPAPERRRRPARTAGPGNVLQTLTHVIGAIGRARNRLRESLRKAPPAVPAKAAPKKTKARAKRGNAKTAESVPMRARKRAGRGKNERKPD